MIPEGTLFAGQYNLLVVQQSILIGILGTDVGLDLAANVVAAKGGVRRAWLAGSTAAMGVAIRSMHYTGMRGFHLPVPVRYHWPTVFLSLCVALQGSAIALYPVRRCSARPCMGRRDHSGEELDCKSKGATFLVGSCVIECRT